MRVQAETVAFNAAYLAEASGGQPLSPESRVHSQREADGRLIHLFLSGDRDAFTALYRNYHPGLFRFALCMTGDRLKAGEVTQDVFVWLIHHAAEFDHRRADLSAFLRGVMRKLLQRRQRDERRWRPVAELQSPSDAADRLTSAADADILRRAMMALPLHYREAVVLCDIEECSYEEAAAVAGCAVGTIRSRLHRARQLLARRLQMKGSKV